MDKSQQDKEAAVDDLKEKKTMPVKERVTKTTQEAKIEVKSDGENDNILYMEGYASTWDNADLDGDIMRRGCFAKTIKERVAAGKVLLMVKHIGHGGDTIEAIGLIIEAKEDDYGLWFKAELYDTELARETHGKVKRSPNAFGTSVGFKAMKYKEIIDKNNAVTGFEFTENALYEITVTACPCNTMTNIEAKKEKDEIVKRIDALEAKVELMLEKSKSVVADDADNNLDSEPDTNQAESCCVSTKAKRERQLAILENEVV